MSWPRSPTPAARDVLVTERGVELRLQHARLRHARAADHGARDRRAGDLRRHPFRAAARRAGRVLGRPARVRLRAGARGGRRRRRRRIHRDPPGSRPRAVGRARTWCRCATSRRWSANCRRSTLWPSAAVRSVNRRCLGLTRLARPVMVPSYAGSNRFRWTTICSATRRRAIRRQTQADSVGRAGDRPARR